MNGFLRSAFIVGALALGSSTFQSAKETNTTCRFNYSNCQSNFGVTLGLLSGTLFFLSGATWDTSKKILIKDEDEESTYKELDG